MQGKSPAESTEIYLYGDTSFTALKNLIAIAINTVDIANSVDWRVVHRPLLGAAK
jgi:hypothetical protein